MEEIPSKNLPYIYRCRSDFLTRTGLPALFALPVLLSLILGAAFLVSEYFN